MDPNCADYKTYKMLSFALTRCKDVMTYEEFLTVQSLFNGADNGSIQTSLDDLGKNLGKLKKYGVALSNLQLGELKAEINERVSRFFKMIVAAAAVHTTPPPA